MRYFLRLEMDKLGGINLNVYRPHIRIGSDENGLIVLIMEDKIRPMPAHGRIAARRDIRNVTAM
ncbi:hypothetical protein D3C84_1291470 [compost metagenome]